MRDPQVPQWAVIRHRTIWTRRAKTVLSVLHPCSCSALFFFLVSSGRRSAAVASVCPQQLRGRGAGVVGGPTWSGLVPDRWELLDLRSIFAFSQGPLLRPGVALTTGLGVILCVAEGILTPRGPRKGDEGGGQASQTEAGDGLSWTNRSSAGRPGGFAGSPSSAATLARIRTSVRPTSLLLIPYPAARHTFFSLCLSHTHSHRAWYLDCVHSR